MTERGQRVTARQLAPTVEEAILDADWLGQALSVRYPGTRVGSVTTVSHQVSTWTKIRLKLQYDSAPEGLTDAICIKALLGEFARQFLGQGAVDQTTEARFYSECAPVLSLNVPECVYIGIDAEVGHGLFIMEDLIAQGAEFGSALSQQSPADVSGALAQLARLHGEAAGRFTPGRLPWVRPVLQDIARQPIIPAELLDELLNGVRGDPLPSRVKDGHRLHNALAALAERFRGRMPMLVHGDLHAGNMYVHDGAVGMIDWQLLQWGSWAQDVAYQIVATMAPETRRVHERDLLAGYLDALRAAGGPALDPDTAWEDYRAACAYGFYLWGITRRVAPDITLEFNRRLGLAVDDHDSFAVLGV
jgi:hypothetical protein